jgi:hypothetical protein
MKIVPYRRSHLQTASFARHKTAHTLHDLCVLVCNWIKSKHFLILKRHKMQDFCVFESPHFLNS